MTVEEMIQKMLLDDEYHLIVARVKSIAVKLNELDVQFLLVLLSNPLLAPVTKKTLLEHHES